MRTTMKTIGLLFVIGSAMSQQVTDWTIVPTNFAPLKSRDCFDQIMNLENIWTGTCEGSYAAVAASVVQDTICVKFDRTAETKADLAKMKVSAVDLLCNCAECQASSGNSCNGGDLKKSLDFLKSPGFVGGSIKDFTLSTTMPEFTDGKKYTTCLNFWTKYCDNSVSGTACKPEDLVFNKANACQKADGKCLTGDTTKLISEVRYSNIINSIDDVSTA